ncbi:hypothetical protein CASFOL_033908 [Castilleja foliolosa]|uniref:Uncharacterized protein n=1 Tax=Castilleja foliolosa TaxID=1961234 RepID=A0ABD3BYV1_9LAMI
MEMSGVEALPIEFGLGLDLHFIERLHYFYPCIPQIRPLSELLKFLHHFHQHANCGLQRQPLRIFYESLSKQIHLSEMAEYGVVTGANKGIGFEVCRQLLYKGITVVLTAKDEKRGLEAVEKLKKLGSFSDRIIFHQLQVTDLASIACLAEFIKSQFGKLDILVNNAGSLGATIDDEAKRVLRGKM